MSAQIIQFPRANRQLESEAGILALMGALNRVNAWNDRPALSYQEAAEWYFHVRTVVEAGLNAEQHE